MKYFLAVLSVFLTMTLAVDGSKFVVSDDAICPPQNEIDEVCSKRLHCESDRDIKICGSDLMCKEYHKIANNLTCVRKRGELNMLLVRNVTHMSDSRTGKAIRYYDNKYKTFVDWNDTCEQNGGWNDTCNEKLREIESQKDKWPASARNFSPWIYTINLDENRIPRDILETKCVFDYCLNRNKNRTTLQYRSIPLMVTRYFHMKGNGSTVFNAEFSYGCICEYNINLNSAQ